MQDALFLMINLSGYDVCSGWQRPGSEMRPINRALLRGGSE